jgi:hypothetical protein
MPEAPAEYNAKVVAEFRAKKGHVGGPWEEIPLTGPPPHRRKVGTGSGKPRCLPVRRLAVLRSGRERWSAAAPSLVPQP